MKPYPFLLTLLFLTVSIGYTQNEPQYPVPISENAEKVGPNTIEFLSYPKYYRTANDELTPVVTNLVSSKAVGWDYEVTTGIWSLYAKTDGTFRADHAGDSFTYQFSDIGTGRGKDFQSLNLGKLNWFNVSVMGDTIRWTDVLPNVDVSVRYINDILKVDVIVKKALMQSLRAKAQNGDINADDFLTAKFNITGVLLTSQAKQGDQVRDLYADASEVNQSLQFWKNGKLVHYLLPVEAYIADEQGQPQRIFENGEDKFIRTAQSWQLLRGGQGYTEVSIYIKDLDEYPIGDLVIDPSISFQQDDVNNYQGCEDAAFYRNENETPDRSTYNYGGGTPLALWGVYANNKYNEYRPLFRFKNLKNSIPTNTVIVAANFTLTLESRSGSGWSSAINVRPIGIERTKYGWQEGTGAHTPANANEVTWSYINYNTNSWDIGGASRLVTNGNSGDNVGPIGETKDILNISTPGTTVTWALYPGVVQEWIELERANNSAANNAGFFLEVNPLLTANGYAYYWHSKQATAPFTRRPKLEVTYRTINLPTRTLTPVPITFNNIGEPYPESPLSPVKFNNQWYGYVNSNYNSRLQTYVVAINDANGMATTDTSKISNYLLRYTTGSPTPMATGTPYPGFQASSIQMSTITPNPNDWYCRMAAIFTTYLETNGSPTPISTRVHGFFHAEDTNDSLGKLYPNNRTYDRIGYVRSNDGVNFTPVNASMSNTPYPGPVVQCFMSEQDWVQPIWVAQGNPTPTPNYNTLDIGGVRHPNVIKKDNYLYLFYDRIIPNNVLQARLYSTVIPTLIPTPYIQQYYQNLKLSLLKQKNGDIESYYGGTSICVARAPLQDFLNYQPTPGRESPWKNYFNDGVSDNYDGFTEPANGGWSSPIIRPWAETSIDPARETPSVSYNLYLNCYTLLSGANTWTSLYGYGRQAIFLHINKNNTLTDWSSGMELDIAASLNFQGTDRWKSYYPQFINKDATRGILGSGIEFGQQAYLYFHRNADPKGLIRVEIQFQD